MRQKIDEKTFELVKILTAGGASIEKIAQHLGISQQSISRCRKAEKYADYRALTTAEGKAADARRKARKAPEPAPEPVKPQVVYHQTDNYTTQLLKEQNEVLKLISAKLAFIVEQLS